MATFVIRSTSTVQTIPELNYDVPLVNTDMVAEGFLITDIVDASTLHTLIESGDITVDSISGMIWEDIGLDGAPGGAVTSVNGEGGAVVLDASEVDLTAGYVAAAGTVAASDPIETAVAKLDGNVQALVTGVSSVNGEVGAVVLDGSEVALTAGYAAAAGTVAASDPVETAVAKLDGNVQALVTGVSSVNGEVGAVTLDASEVDMTAGYTATSGGAAVAPSDPVETAVAKLDGRGPYYGMTVFESTAIAQNTSATLADKINQSVTLEAGDYMVEVSASYNIDTTTSDFIADVLVDGSSVSSEAPAFQLEAKDSAGAGPTGSGTDQRDSFSLRYKRTLTAGLHSFQLQFGPSVGGNTTSMWDAMITVSRIS